MKEVQLNVVGKINPHLNRGAWGEPYPPDSQNETFDVKSGGTGEDTSIRAR